METLEDECHFGAFIWQISQGLWDALPTDSRTDLLEAAKILIHGFFHEEVQAPLVIYAMRKLNG